MFAASKTAGAVSAEVNYIEDVFSTYLYTGNGSTQTITNGIDLAGKGGLVWVKKRIAAASHGLYDTTRGAGQLLITDNANAQATYNGVNGFSASGFSLGSGNEFNQTTQTFASWTFRKQPKFFDVVTWTGDGTNPRQIAHNLGSVPGCIIIKSTTRAENWTVYHTSLGNTGRIALNTTAAAVTGTGVWASTTPTSTYFTVSADNLVNFSGDGYVAYVFAHDAGGFGLTGTDNVISCGSYTGTGAAGNVITLGYEPQWILAKAASGGSAGTQYWQMYDTMRGMPVGVGNDAALYPNVSNAEATGQNGYSPTATGFETDGSNSNLSGVSYIYIAIRRGPMKVPTSGTSVFAPVVVSENTTPPYINTFTTGFPVDSVIEKFRGGSQTGMFNRLLGGNYLIASTTAAEASSVSTWDSMTASNVLAMAGSSGSAIGWNFRRAPSFFDEVCYTGTGSARTINHNLGAVPELMIMKNRSTTGAWYTYAASLGVNEALQLNQDFAQLGFGYWNSTAPTSSVFSIGAGSNNDNGVTYVAYLFATCAGVSKVFSYTGNGSSQTINCGFTGGARFVLIKRTDSTGDWYVWDSARGIVSGNDPHLSLNTTAAEVTTDDTIDTDSTGFVVNQVSATNVNVSSATYIGIAIA